MDAPPPPPPLNGPSGAAPPGTADFVDAPAAAVNGWAHHQAFVKPDPQQDPEQDQQQQQQQQLAAYDGGGYVPVAPPGPAATDSDVKPASLLCPPTSAPPAAGADDVGVGVNNHADFTEMQRLSEEYTPDVHVLSPGSSTGGNAMLRVASSAGTARWPAQVQQGHRHRICQCRPHLCQENFGAASPPIAVETPD